MSVLKSLNTLIDLLTAMDRTQAKTDDAGEREIAWYWFRNDIEDALGLPRGALNTTLHGEEDQR